MERRSATHDGTVVIAQSQRLAKGSFFAAPMDSIRLPTIRMSSVLIEEMDGYKFCNITLPQERPNSLEFGAVWHCLQLVSSTNIY